MSFNIFKTPLAFTKDSSTLAMYCNFALKILDIMTTPGLDIFEKVDLLEHNFKGVKDVIITELPNTTFMSAETYAKFLEKATNKVLDPFLKKMGSHCSTYIKKNQKTLKKEEDTEKKITKSFLQKILQ